MVDFAFHADFINPGVSPVKYTTQIEHVVVLMMENHSFDNMLGWLPGVGQLTGTESNEYNGRIYTTRPKRECFATVPGPLHEFANVNLQVLGAGYRSPDPGPANCPPNITMSGFVQDYIEHANP